MSDPIDMEFKKLQNRIEELEAALADAEEHRVEHLLRIQKLEASLFEAIDDIAHWASFADDYFKWKWDLAGDLAKHRRVLEADQ